MNAPNEEDQQQNPPLPDEVLEAVQNLTPEDMHDFVTLYWDLFREGGKKDQIKQSRKKKVLLVGFMGAGKSTIGNIILHRTAFTTSATVNDAETQACIEKNDTFLVIDTPGIAEGKEYRILAYTYLMQSVNDIMVVAVVDATRNQHIERFLEGFRGLGQGFIQVATRATEEHNNLEGYICFLIAQDTSFDSERWNQNGSKASLMNRLNEEDFVKVDGAFRFLNQASALCRLPENLWAKCFTGVALAALVGFALSKSR